MIDTGVTHPGTHSLSEGSGLIAPIAPRASQRAPFPHAADHRAGPGRLPSVSRVPRGVRHTGLVAIPGAGAPFKSP
jgi:hypothetical protein